jgi:dihydroxyacid dehydratase/phosphogluconate dehydratase
LHPGATAAKSVGMNDKPTGIARGLTNYGDRDFSLYLRRSFAQSMGYSREMLAKPVVGIAYTASGFNNCHRHFPELLEAVKRGVLTAGALPIEFPTISLGEVFLNPTSLKFRNLMSVDTEEMVRAQPMDAVVLMGGCDKTVPAQLMGAVWARARIAVGSGRNTAPARLMIAKFLRSRASSPRPRARALSWERPRRWRASPRRSA